MLKYIKNLSLIRKRLTPDLYTIISAAKQTVSDEFAILLAETAKNYNYKSTDEDSDFIYNQFEEIHFSVNAVSIDGYGEFNYFNRLPGRNFFWKNVRLKKKPLTEKRKNQFKQLWNPNSICSWPPEDVKIENFNKHIKNYARSLMTEAYSKTEKFSASFKDGLDIRETLKNWHTNDIYVKENPLIRGSVDTVLIFFEMPLDHEKYTWRTTLWAEHKNESTISIIATNYKDDIIGPGIGRAKYAAIALWYPPRFFNDIWIDKEFSKYYIPEHRLAAAALKYSYEKNVVIVSPAQPDTVLKKIAVEYKKKWIYIPLRKFSRQTISRLREIHILNGHKVRTYAADFIRG